jgi:hypothetical protein
MHHLPPVLMSFSRSVVSVHLRTDRGSARRRGKPARLYAVAN